MWKGSSVPWNFWALPLHERLGAINLGSPEGTDQGNVVTDIAIPRLLSVTDFATIEKLDIELSADFSLLTGETGAGKPIIVDALSLPAWGTRRC